MPSRSRRKKSSNQNQNHNQNDKAVLVEVTDAKKLLHHHHSHEKQASVCFEGHRLSTLLDSFHREIQYERNGNKVLPEKLWFKQHFAVGVNEVTRVLERMLPSIDGKCSIPQVEDFPYLLHQVQRPAPFSSATRLQVVLVASDCNPRWLTKHLLSLASSRNVPLIYVKDEREGSLRLGELVKVKTAIALGVKVKGSSINRLVERVYSNDLLNGRLDDDCTL